MSDDISQKESYGYWEWHLRMPRNKPLTRHGKSFNHVQQVAVLVQFLPAAALAWLILYATYHTQWPEYLKGIAGAIFLLLYIFFFLTLNYLTYPVWGQFAHEFKWIDDEEYEWIKRRRIPGSFALPLTDVNAGAKNDAQPTAP